jgi:hypothetical protein
LSLKISDLLKGAVLLGGITHVMIFMNGYWNDALWMSVILNVGIPIVIYKYLKMGNKKKRTRLPPKEL